MTTRKRQASDPLLPTRAPKSRRTEGNHILERWCELGIEFITLGLETVRHLMNPSQNSAPSEPPSPHANSFPTRKSDTPPRITRKFNLLSVSSRLPIPDDVHNPSQISSSLPSPSESSNALNGHPASSPSTLTGYTSVTSNPSISKEIVPSCQSYEFIERPACAQPTYYSQRTHIYDQAHKVKVQADVIKAREAMVEELFHHRRATGYTSDFDAFKSFINYQARLELLDRHALSPSPSLTDLRSKPSHELSRRHSFSDDVDFDFLERALENAKKSFESPLPKLFSPTHDRIRSSARHKDEAIEKLLRQKRFPKALPPDADLQVSMLLCKKGIISRIAREAVNDRDLSRLLPSQWLNDEIINFYGAMILTRSETSHNSNSMPDVHYFSTFFWPKLSNEGYERGRLAKWTKKIDIFSKDVILIPINHHNSHWTGAAINFRRKRIESYDSMNIDRRQVYKALRHYLDCEHKNKKKKAFDFTDWADHSRKDTPQQENGHDCGVFMCQFLESLSRGEEVFCFAQRDMAYLRRRMIWEIGHAKFLDSGP